MAELRARISMLNERLQGEYPDLVRCCRAVLMSCVPGLNREVDDVMTQLTMAQAQLRQEQMQAALNQPAL